MPLVKGPTPGMPKRRNRRFTYRLVVIVCDADSDLSQYRRSDHAIVIDAAVFSIPTLDAPARAAGVAENGRLMVTGREKLKRRSSGPYPSVCRS